MHDSDNDPSVAHLLLVYKDFYPEIDIGNYGFRRGHFPTACVIYHRR